jgi:Zn-dependent protease with chaperone function
LEAVLLHEAGHLSLGDHRSRVWSRAYQRLLFFFPGGRRLHQDLVHEQERRADRRALEWRPDLKEDLRKALFYLATQDFSALASAEAFPLSLPQAALGQDVWSVQQRLLSMRGVCEGLPSFSWSLRWCLPGVGLLLLLTLGETGPCTLHCALAALP